MGPDHRQQGAARANALVDGFPKVLARFNAGHVHENSLLTEVLLELIEQTASFAF